MVITTKSLAKNIAYKIPALLKMDSVLYQDDNLAIPPHSINLEIAASALGYKTYASIGDTQTIKKSESLFHKRIKRFFPEIQEIAIKRIYLEILIHIQTIFYLRAFVESQKSLSSDLDSILDPYNQA